MGAFDHLGDLLHRARSGHASEADVQAAYDHVSRTAPPQQLEDGIAHALRSDATPPFPRLVTELFGHSNPEQRAGLLNTLLAKLNPADRPSSLPPGEHAGGAALTPEQAARVPLDDVTALAARAEGHDASVVDRAAAFYAQHPQLVKTLGAAALTVLLARAQTRH